MNSENETAERRIDLGRRLGEIELRMHRTEALLESVINMISQLRDLRLETQAGCEKPSSGDGQ